MAPRALDHAAKMPPLFAECVNKFHKKEDAKSFWTFLAKDPSNVAKMLIKEKDLDKIEKTIKKQLKGYRDFTAAERRRVGGKTTQQPQQRTTSGTGIFQKS